MQMPHKIFLDQLKRSKKTLVYLCLLLLTSAFFVTSVNLYHNSSGNLKVAEEAFSTLAVTELYGEVDRYGNLVERNSQEHIGYKAVGVRGYDFSQLIDSEAVESWDLRRYYGAYISGPPAMFYAPPVIHSDGRETPGWMMRSNNIIRFKTRAEEPIPVHYYPPSFDNIMKGSFFSLDVLEETGGYFAYPERMGGNDLGFRQAEWDAWAEDIKKFNRSENTDDLIFYPDVEYVAILRNHGSWLWSEEKQIWEYSDEGSNKHFELATPYQDATDIRLTYDENQEKLEYQWGYSPFPIQRWEDVQNDPQLKAYFEELWQNIQVQQHVHNVIATNDVTSIPAFHLGKAALTEGRLITPEEYESGAKVCLISETVAKGQGWKLGDKLDMQLFESDYLTTGWNQHSQPIYKGEETPFVDSGDYEIVGIYSIYSTMGNTELAVNTTEMTEFDIFVPTNSIAAPRDLSQVLVHGSTFSIKLKNGSVEQFEADMAQKDLTEGGYVPTFHFYDQGYSAVKSSLLSMNSTAKLLLLLSSILLLIVCVLVAYFFWQNQRQSVGIFRLLGGTKKQALSALLLCALLLTILATAAGALLGHGLAYVVGTGIVKSNVAEIEMDLSQDIDLTALTTQESNIKVQAEPLVTLCAGGAVLLYPLCLLGFAALDINKEPRELLPKGKG